jgi:signal transduction histidine kinase
VKHVAALQDESRDFQRDSGASPGEGHMSDDTSVPSRAGYADFFARVSHDLRSPLGIVMHVMQRLEADLGKQFSDEQKVLMKLGARGVRRLQSFVERVALLSELENDDLDVNLQPVDLAQVVRRAVETNIAHEARAEISVTFEPPSGQCMALADPSLLSRIVTELLSNAVAHARKAVRASVTSDASAARIVIEDDGPGVADHARSSLYKRFVVRDARGGLGIGLSMAQELAHVQSGDLQLESSTLPPGRPGTVGARFVLSLPHVTVTQGPARD